jgi:hypothetical protein
MGSVVGAKRRWPEDFAESDHDRQGKGVAAAVAVEKWESRSDFQGRFVPGFSTAFYPPMIGHFSPFSRRGFRIDSPRISIRWA